jgi:hypothetical protein
VSLAAAVGMAVVLYGVYVSVSLLTYGHHYSGASAASTSAGGNSDPLLDRFMLQYEVVERHHIRVGAPAEIAFAAAKELDLQQSPVVRAIFRSREAVMGASGDRTARPRGIVALTTSLGWGVLAETPTEIVLGAVTQPWNGDVVFHAVPPGQFAAFQEPGFVKIVWNLRADAIDRVHSEAITETRVITTDAAARAKFRRYWAFASPGIIVIRWVSMGLLKDSAERVSRQRVTGSSEE